MCAAHTLYTNDHWIHYITDMPVIWIPSHHCRLLHTNLLLSMLRSELGIKCSGMWFDGEWNSALCHDLDELLINTYITQPKSRHFTFVYKTMKWRWLLDPFAVSAKISSTISTWNNISALTVNVNGIHCNGHILSTTSYPSTLFLAFNKPSFMTEISWNHSSFYHNLKCNTKTFSTAPTVRNFIQLTIEVAVWSEIPGYTSAEEITERSIQNRYLVLRLLIQNNPVYYSQCLCIGEGRGKSALFWAIALPQFWFSLNASRIRLSQYTTQSSYPMLRVEQLGTSQPD